MLTKMTKVQKVTVEDDGFTTVYSIQTIEEDGKIISETGIERTIKAGDDISKEEGLVKEITDVVHTSKRVAAQEAVDAQKAIDEVT